MFPQKLWTFRTEFSPTNSKLIANNTSKQQYQATIDTHNQFVNNYDSEIMFIDSQYNRFVYNFQNTTEDRENSVCLTMKMHEFIATH